MTQVVLVRHGESVWNREGRLQGQSPENPHLTERGRQQAAAVCAVLNRTAHWHVGQQNGHMLAVGSAGSFCS